MASKSTHLSSCYEAIKVGSFSLLLQKYRGWEKMLRQNSAPLTTKEANGSPLSPLFHKTTAEKQTTAELCKNLGVLLF